MRRRDKEITDPGVIKDVIRRASTCYLALIDEDQPYIVPLNFGIKDDVLYAHSAPQGRKLDIIRKNASVCVLFDVDQEIVDRGEKACRWSTKYRSVMAFGKASIIEDDKAKIEGLDILMHHYGEGPFEYDSKSVSECVVIKVEIDRFSGKSSGY